MGQRKSISKKLRFEVFKRDNFQCQYCGRKAPDVILEVDHIEPVKGGGGNDMLNLITSCEDCNAGKGARKLTDSQMIDQQRKQLEELNARREQMRMMLQWKKELLALEDEQIDEIEKLILIPYNRSLTEHGKGDMRRAIKKFGFSEVWEAAIISHGAYYKDGDDSCHTKILHYIPGICANRQKNAADPTHGKKSYLLGILKNRFRLTDYGIKNVRARVYGMKLSLEYVEELTELAKAVDSIWEFDNYLDTYEVE
jgi:hypothetical protein